MHQQSNSINPSNIQHFVDSAANAIELGQRQFFTPPLLAAALCSVFRGTGAMVATDLMAGAWDLLKAAPCKRTFGIDVDARQPTVKGGTFYQADVTRFYPLAKAAGLDHDLLLLNPPFSLRWYLDRLAPLAESSAVGVAAAYAEARRDGDTIDSTLATFLIALDSLIRRGEGMMICNANTARRLIGDPTDPSAIESETSLLRNVWCWLEIPDTVFAGQHTVFPTAVLYFSASHGHSRSHPRPPLFLTAPSSDARTVETTLATALSARPFAYLGHTINYAYEAQSPDAYATLWDAVRGEYHALYHGTPPPFNLMLGEKGTIRTHLDPYRKAAYVHNRDLLTAFRAMQGETPAALVVQRASRAALRHAMTSGHWRVQPELVAAVDAAVRAYEAVRAPFYVPSPVQSLGWLDEEDSIICQAHGIDGFRPDAAYPIKTWIETTKDTATRVNTTTGSKELINITGRELVIAITDDHGTVHHFHVRRDPDLPETDSSGRHHAIQSLIAHFRIPVPQDVAAVDPALYQHHLATLAAIEARVNSGERGRPARSAA